MSLSIQYIYKISSKIAVFCSGEMVNKRHVSSQLVVSLYVFPMPDASLLLLLFKGGSLKKLSPFRL